MRELRAEELHWVAGGFKPQDTTLPPIVVHPDPVRHDTLPYQPPHTNGGSNNGGGSPGGAANGGLNGGGKISTQTAAGIAKIKGAYGVDVTAYAQMSVSLADAIALATSSYDFKFEWGNNNTSATNWTDGSHGTISIDHRYEHDTASFLQQLAHELGHVGWRVTDNPRNESADAYVNANLHGEGVATMMNERVQHEILAAGGPDIHVASSNRANTEYYDVEYARWKSGAESYDAAVNHVANYYGQAEHTASGQSYDAYYRSYYHSHGGRQ